MESESSTKGKDALQTLDSAGVEFQGSLVASTLAHEIRNPLQSIKLQLDIANRAGVNSETISNIEAHVRRLEEVVEKVQKLGDRYIAHVEKVNLRDLIQESLKSIQFWLNASGIETRTHYNWEGDPICTVDRELIEQVLLNLFMNSIQAMGSGGVLSVYVSEELEHVVVRVSDTGEGIDSKNLKIVGTPFFTTKANGNGLGLAFCKTIAALHGGTLEIQSTPKSGTQVTLRILTDATPREEFDHVQ